jgi:hypothetical protein
LAVPRFQTTEDFSMDSAPPVMRNGVNPGERLGIVFDMKPDTLFADILAGLNSGDLRVGLHVQGIPGGSGSFVSVPGPGPSATALPDAAQTAMLLGLAMAVLGVRRKLSA